MRYLVIYMLLISTVGLAQQKSTSEGNERVRISTIEKQNKEAKEISKLLLQAWCMGDITAYYPKNQTIEMSYAQFLNHFGMEEYAYTLLNNQTPSWFCSEKKLRCIPIDPLTMQCLQYEIELGEENYFNQQKSTQEKRIDYVKLIYSSICDVRGIELEGPVFKMKDIKKLNKQKYKVRNPQNDAATLDVWSYLTIGNFKRTTIYKRDEFVNSPSRVDANELRKRVDGESVNWEQ